MKKMVCVVLALLLCLNAAALAEYVPSKTTDDMTQIVVSVENAPADAAPFVMPITEEIPEHQEFITIYEKEVSKLAVTPVLEYFTEVKDAEGNPVDLTAILNTEEPKVYEFVPVVAGNYDENYGMVTATMYFSTPYEEGQKVVVMIGIVTVAEDDTETIEWIAYEGVVVTDGQNTGVQVVLDPATVLAVQNNIAMLAVVSQ